MKKLLFVAACGERIRRRLTVHNPGRCRVVTAARRDVFLEAIGVDTRIGVHMMVPA